tara:strand:- start:1115 stop:2476 length:1362 start_codon:yes stop_codon:yes gene_type:complete
MGPEKLGLIAFAASSMAILGSLVYLGFNQSHSKRVSEGRDTEVCISTYLLIQITLTTLMALAGLFLVYYVINYEAIIETIIYIFIISLVFESLSQVSIVTFEATLEINTSEFLKIVRKIVFCVLSIIVCITSRNVIHLALVTLVATIIQFLLGTFLLKRKYSLKRPSIELAKSYKDFALPLMFIMVLGVISINIDKLMIGAFFEYNEVGYYSLPQTIFVGLGMISMSAASIIFPKISEYHRFNKIKEIRNLVTKTERYLSIIAFPLVILVIVLAEPIVINVFSEQFAPSIPIFQIMSMVVLMTFLNRPYTVMITGMDKPKLLAKLSSSCILIGIILNIIFIPNELFGYKLLGLGAIGAALTTSMIWIIQFPVYRYWSYKFLGIGINKQLLPPIISSVSMGLILYIISKNYLVDDITTLFLLSFLGMIIYFFFMIISKGLGKDDLLFIKRILKI